MWLAPARLTRQAGHNEREPTMTKFPWKTTLAGAALLAATVYAFAQHPGMTGPHGAMHEQMLQGQGAINGNGQHGAMHGQSFGAMPTLPGQDAFGAIQEVVQILQADPKTDWSKVDIAALRQHLIDMNEVTLHAEAVPRMTATGIDIAVTGEGRTLAAIKRMVPAHVHELESLDRGDAEWRQTRRHGQRRRAAGAAQGARLHRYHGAGRPSSAASSHDRQRPIGSLSPAAKTPLHYLISINVRAGCRAHGSL
jgi:hypothetical protein